MGYRMGQSGWGGARQKSGQEVGPDRKEGGRAVGCQQHLGLVGLLQLLPVQPHLLLMLAPQFLQGLCHLEVIFLLPAAVHLHQAPLMPPPCLSHFLEDTSHEPREQEGMGTHTGGAAQTRGTDLLGTDSKLSVTKVDPLTEPTRWTVATKPHRVPS